MTETWALQAMVVGGWCPEITPAARGRDWMDATKDRFAYRCKPLVAANDQAWWLRLPCDVVVGWNGSSDLSAVTVDIADPEHEQIVSSHFGHGVVTFSVPLLLRTPPGMHTLVKGPGNLPLDGISPLEGVVETDWAVATFTMNWKLTRPVRGLRMEAGFPYCEIRPVPAHLAAAAEPVLTSAADDPELYEQHAAWALGRRLFLEERRIEDQRALGHTWEKDYFVEAQQRGRGVARVAPFAGPAAGRPDGSGAPPGALPARTFLRALRVAEARGGAAGLVDALRSSPGAVELPEAVADQLGVVCPSGGWRPRELAGEMVAAIRRGDYPAWSKAFESDASLAVPTGPAFGSALRALLEEPFGEG